MKRFLLLLSITVGFILNTKAQQRVQLVTSQGTIEIILYDETPKHKANFLKLVQEGFYDSLLFHRVIPKFMIQGGDPQSKNARRTRLLGNGGPGYDLAPEITNKRIHKKGALAAARQPDDVNPNKRSNGSQFYIVQGSQYPRKYLSKFEKKRGEKYTEEQMIAYETLGGTPHLDGEYTVFGEVIKGLDVVERIANVQRNRADRPLQDIYILKTKVIK